MTITLVRIQRYPVKGLSPESLDGVRLEPGQTLPADRMYAIENGPSHFDPAVPAYLAKTYFLMLMKNERLATLDTLYDEDTHVLTIHGAGHDLPAEHRHRPGRRPAGHGHPPSERRQLAAAAVPCTGMSSLMTP